MEKDTRKKLLIPFLVFLGFIALSVKSVYRGIVHGETWRIVFGSIGGVAFTVFVVLIVYTVIKNEKKAA